MPTTQEQQQQKQQLLSRTTTAVKTTTTRTGAGTTTMCLRTSAFRIMAAKQKGNGNCCYENENEKRAAKNSKK